DDCFAAAKETGILSEAKEAALIANRKQLRKLEAQMVMQAHNARKLLRALGEKRQLLVRLRA
ncbi:hypothetical protein ETH_00037920, partial [Eimeria tenella]